MKKRLQRHERLAVKNEIELLELYQMLRNPLKYYEQQMTHFKLSAEEMFCDSIEVLDIVKSSSYQLSKQHIRGLYSLLYCDYRDLAGDKVPDVEVQTATTAVVYSLIIFLSLSDSMLYNNLVTELHIQLIDNKIDIVPVRQQFMTAFYRINADQAQQAYTAYMQGDFCLSDRLQTIIDNTVQALSVPATTISTPPDDRFTQKQVVIFIIEALNIALTEINLTALACFIEKLTGYKGIRPILVNLKNAKIEYTHTDAEKVANYLKDIKPDLATTILNGVSE